MAAVTYFAYGSNMLTRRLTERVGEVKIRGRGWVCGHQLRFHKVSVDGSAKCNIHETGSPSDVVHGVVFELDEIQKRLLDVCEGLGKGYEEAWVRVSLNDERVLRAVAYRATSSDDGLRPYCWYHALVVAGANEHGLPRPYVESIEEIQFRKDPDEDRMRANLRILAYQ